MTPREKRRNEKVKKNNLNKKEKIIKNYQNYLLTISYDGSFFGGYAKQKFSNTIEEKLTTTIKNFLNEDVKLIESSRTDAKVHAYDQKVMFKSSQNFNIEKFLKIVNLELPDSIEVLDIKKVNKDFHSRYDVKNKTYVYKIHTKKDIFLNNYSHFIDIESFDIKKINDICSLFLGEHDFIGFSSSKRDSKTTIRNIYDFSFQKDRDNHYFFEITADGFLYNMIRILIPTILDSYFNNLSSEEIISILNSKDRNKASETISPRGLYLKKINYKDEYEK